jgi:hemoglobin
VRKLSTPVLPKADPEARRRRFTGEARTSSSLYSRRRPRNYGDRPPNGLGIVGRVPSLFGEGQPQHVDHLTAFTAESFGGPDRFTRELGGMEHLIAVHRGLEITEEQRERFVELYLAALDDAGMPTDAPFRDAVREHLEFGTQVAMQNSHARTDTELHPLREVPRWTWEGDD